MKKFKIKSFIYGIALTSMSFAGCTDLDVPVESEITPSNFPKTEEDFVAVASAVYSSLSHKNLNGEAYWLTQELTTDAMILTANGGRWYDAARWKQLYQHSYDKDNSVVSKAWTWGFSVVSTCNRVLQLLNEAPESSEKNSAIAEIRTVRAFALWAMTDLYGDIPLVTTFGETADGRKPRKDVCSFIETEVLESLPDLKTAVSSATYGRPTKWMAYAFLAKLYLNAPIYAGQSKHNEVVAMCDKIIEEANQNGSFALSSDYLKMFDIDNGPQIKDFIFAIPYDCNNITGQYFARWWLHPLLQSKYSLPYAPSGSIRTIPEFYAKFNDATDVRNKVWLTGKQYNNDGSPILITTTNKGYDARYTGSNPNQVITVQLEFTPAIEFRDYTKFDTGDDVAGKQVGYRLNKFLPDKNSLTRDQSNDVPVYRYADVLLMKAEAILRGATATLGQTPLSLVNLVRTRAKATPFTSIDLESLLDERARELVGENWRRNDLIRFGKFETTWPFKTDADPNHRVFPIPSTEIALNPSLGQNPGY
ncbi:MAG: RagB/SusD family nutrient uptake outer membrane protein [Mangrovibacterium sp.]